MVWFFYAGEKTHQICFLYEISVVKQTSLVLFLAFSQGPLPVWDVKPQPVCSWDTWAQSPLPFNLTLKHLQMVPFQTHSTFPLCHELQRHSSFHKSSRVWSSWKPGRSRMSWALFRPGAVSSNLLAPSPGSQPPEDNPLLLFHCSSFPIRVTNNLLFPNAILLCTSSLNHLVD